jgi:hypothetical protein
MSIKPLASALLVLGCLSGSLQATTFNVTNGNTEGAGSLRQALIDANNSPGKDQVVIDASVTNIYRNVTPNGDPLGQ